MQAVPPLLNRKVVQVCLVICMLFIVTLTLSQDVESDEDDANEDIVVTSLVNNDVENPVVANVRLLSIDGSNSELVFTEPLRGQFSIAPATRACLQGSGCEWSTHNLSNDSHSSSPVRVSHAEINGPVSYTHLTLPTIYSV